MSATLRSIRDKLRTLALSVWHNETKKNINETSRMYVKRLLNHSMRAWCLVAAGRSIKTTAVHFHCQQNIKRLLTTSQKLERESKMDAIRNGWFSEISEELWPAQCYSLRVKEVFHEEKSQFQDIKLLDT